MENVSQAQDVALPAGAPGSAAPTFAGRLAECFRSGIAVGLRTAAWLLAIMVPISLAVVILSWTGVLGLLAGRLQPAFGAVGLPAETAIAFLTGVLLNIYSGIAALGAIPLTERQVTILALMMLISHNFPVEAAVQRKAGSSAWRMVALRLTASVVGALLLHWVLPPGDDAPRTRGIAAAGAVDLAALLRAWAVGTAWLAGKVIAIVMALMVLQRVLREFGVIQVLSGILWPVLWLLGLPHRTAFLWIVANVLGLAYGAAVILEETRGGAIDRRDAELLNRSIGVCHSLLEDTLLFVAIGAWVWPITLPRLGLAGVAVWTYRALRSKEAGHAARRFHAS